MMHPRLKCDKCGKRSLHNVQYRPELDLNDTQLISSCCNEYKTMGIIAKRLVAQGMTMRAAKRFQTLYWEIHEPFELMTPTEKGQILSLRYGVKTDYVNMFNGNYIRSVERAIAKEKERHKKILCGKTREEWLRFLNSPAQ